MKNVFNSNSKVAYKISFVFTVILPSLLLYVPATSLPVRPLDFAQQACLQRPFSKYSGAAGRLCAPDELGGILFSRLYVVIRHWVFPLIFALKEMIEEIRGGGKTNPPHPPHKWRVNSGGQVSQE
jgi:hypothetical protein